MENSKKVEETLVQEAKEVVNSVFTKAEVIKEVGKRKYIAEGSGSWYRLVEREGKKENILFTNGSTTFGKFKKECLPHLPKKQPNTK